MNSNDRLKQWRKDNPERTTELNKRWTDKKPEAKKKANHNWYVQNRERELQRRKARAYDFSPEEQEQMLKAQNGVCAICGKSDEPRSLCIDHNHKTGKVRGFLCRKCNYGLGRFEDNISLLEKAIKYLRR